MKYSISEIAELLGISPVSVRNYEKSGLIMPERNNTNNYRQYNAIDLNLIRRARHLMTYGFTLSEATRILKEEPMDSLAESLMQKSAEIRERILLEQKLMYYIQQHAECIQRYSIGGSGCILEMSPSLYGFFYRDGIVMRGGDDLAESVRRWNDNPFTETLLRYQKDAFCEGHACYHAGLGIEKRYVEGTGLEDDPHAVFFPSQKSVHFIFEAEFEPNLPHEFGIFLEVQRWMESQGFSVAGDPLARVLCTTKSSGIWKHHLEIWVPVE